MNIGIVTTWYPAGAGYVSKAYEEALSRKHKVFIYARDGQNRKSDAAWDHSNVTWAPHNYNGTGIWKSHFKKWVKKNNISHVLFNEQRCWYPVVYAKELGLICGAYIDYYTQETVPAFAIYDFLICNTKRHYSVFKWHPQCFYIPWGTDTRQFVSQEPGEKRILTFLASAGWQPNWNGDRRGTLLALEAFSNVTGDCKFEIYSQVPLEKMTERWRSALTSDSRIVLKVGTFDPFPYNNADVYVYPSRLDGIGLTVPEALASGCAVIATDAAPMNEFVKDGINGSLVSVNTYIARSDGYYWPESYCDMAQLTLAMQRYIDSPDILTLHKKNARSDAEHFLNWSVNAHELPSIFDEIKLRKPTHQEISQVVSLDKCERTTSTRQFLKMFSKIPENIFSCFRNLLPKS